MTFTLNTLNVPTSAGERGTFKFSSDVTVLVDQVGISIRDASDANFDLAPRTGPFNLGPHGFTYISDPLAADLPPGDYTAWASAHVGGVWTQIGVAEEFTVQGSTTPPSPPSLVPGKAVVFDAPFSDTTNWTVGRTSSYPGSSPQTNTGDNKLDRISPSISAPVGGVFNATRYNSTYWNADLVTTEYAAGGGFEMLPGDTLTADVTLGSERGAWPAIWTWGRDYPPGYSGVQPGHGEVDFFEYHTDNPNLLELSNRTRSGAYHYYTNSQIAPGLPFALRVDVDTDSVVWFINGQQVWEDGQGVPSYWRAWLIVNLSVCAGQWHPAPLSSQTSMQYAVENLRVWR